MSVIWGCPCQTACCLLSSYYYYYYSRRQLLLFFGHNFFLSAGIITKLGRYVEGVGPHVPHEGFLALTH